MTNENEQNMLQPQFFQQTQYHFNYFKKTKAKLLQAARCFRIAWFHLPLQLLLHESCLWFAHEALQR